MLNFIQCPLWLGCTMHMKLLIIVRMLSVKSDYNTPYGCFGEMMMLLKETNPKRNFILLNTYKTKKLVSKLGLRYKKINYCINGYILYYKGDENGEVINFMV